MYDASFELLTDAAEEGHAGAQHELAAAYNTGVYGGLVPTDPTRAMLLEYMSSLSGNAEAHMGMGFKYVHGVGVKRSCERALVHYEYAANEVIRQLTSSPIGLGRMELERGVTGGGSQLSPFRGGHPLHLETVKLSEFFQASSTNGKQQEFDEELIEFYCRLAEEGDVNAAYNLGLVYYYGTRVIDQDIKLAIYYLHKSASNGYTRSSFVPGASTSGTRGGEGPTPIVGNGGMGGVDNSSMIGNHVTNSHVLSARGLLGYILAKGEYFRAPQWFMPATAVGGAPPSAMSEGAVMATAKQAMLGYLIGTLQLGYVEMITMLRYGAANNEPNALAGLAYLTMTGTRCDTAVVANPNPNPTSQSGQSGRVNACGRNNEHAEIMDFPKNTSKAVEMLAPLLSRHPDAGFYIGEIMLSNIRMVEVKPLSSLEEAPVPQTSNSVESSSSTSSSTSMAKDETLSTKVRSITRVTREGGVGGNYEHIVEVEEEHLHGEENIDADDVIENHDMKQLYKHLLRDEGVFSGRGAGAARGKKFEMLQQQQRRRQRSRQGGGGVSTAASGGSDADGNVGDGYVFSESADTDGVSMSSSDAELLPQEPRKAHKLVKRLRKYAVHPDSTQDAAQALLMYVSSSQRGNIQATHRLGHLLARGIGAQKSCESALQSFKTVAEHGDWSYELTVASRYVVEEGKYAAALRIYNKFALMGYESAQGNAAYILTNLYSPSWLLPTERIVAADGVVADSGTGADAGADTEATLPVAVDGATGTGFTSTGAGASGADSVFSLPVNMSSRVDGSIAIIPAPKWTAQQQYHMRRKGVVLGDMSPPLAPSDSADTATPSMSTGATTGDISEAEKLHLVGIVDIGEEPSHPAGDAGGETEGVVRPEAALLASVHDAASTLSKLLFPTHSSSHLYSKADCESRAMTLYAQSAMQGSGESYAKLGDMFYYGMAWLDSDKGIALEFYKVAAGQGYTNAIFSVGLMHEFGEGVPHEDFYLAKRYYDMGADSVGTSSGGSQGQQDQGRRTTTQRIPALVANQMLKIHQYLRLQFGEETTENIIHSIGTACGQVAFMFGDVSNVIQALRKKWYRLPTLSKLIQQYTFYDAAEELIIQTMEATESIMKHGEEKYISLWIEFNTLGQSQSSPNTNVHTLETDNDHKGINHVLDFDTLLICLLVVLFLLLSHFRQRHLINRRRARWNR